MSFLDSISSFSNIVIALAIAPRFAFFKSDMRVNYDIILNMQ